MKRLKDTLLHRDATILQAMEQLDRTALQILLVVDGDDRLLGSITDGDIRRALLEGSKLDRPVAEIMRTNPATIAVDTPRERALALMREKGIHSIPVLDHQGRVVALESENHLLWRGVESSWVVLMAGGLGMRLRPLTESLPKPMLPVNGTPILERILNRFVEQGFRRFFVSVNYRAEIIKSHFGDGSRWGVELSYLEEDQRLGTAGALSLLPTENRAPHILVMNGDILTSVDFRRFLDFHRETEADGSMCVRDYSIEVPYGVVEAEGHRYCGMTEKPAHHYYINAGIYALNSSMVDLVPRETFFDITELFEVMRSKRKRISVFPMREQWQDVGNVREYQKANGGVD